MMPPIDARQPPTKSVLYCRVSSKKQTVDGAGLMSQEHRCREYAESRGYEVEAVFPDDVSGGGDFMNRPGMVALLAYLDANPNENYVVIFDDLKRYARDTEFHLKLRREMAVRGAVRECLNFNFEDTPEGKFVETIIAAQSELEREQIGRQSKQKMMARLEQGYWVFRAPVGYKYIPAKGGGKVLVPNEPLATTVKAALEGYATGRFTTQAEVGRFLEADPLFPKDTPSGGIRPMTIKRFLQKEVYAGLVSAPKWKVSTRLGKHKGLISVEAFERIQQKLAERTYAPKRIDLNEEFPLRGAVACSCCGTPYTAGMCKGKYKKYPYYFCRATDCEAYGKTIPRDKLEGEFRKLLGELRLPPYIFKIAEAMFADRWREQARTLEIRKQAITGQADAIDSEIDNLTDKIVEASNSRVISALEQRIDGLERKQVALREKAVNLTAPRKSYRELFELSMRFLENPCILWDSGRLDCRRMVLQLGFSSHLIHCRETGVRTPDTSLPFKFINHLREGENQKMEKCEMVPLE